MCLSQLHLMQKRDEKAAEVLGQLSKRGRARPHIAKAIIDMHMRQKNPEKAVASLREAMRYWTEDEESEKDLGQILRMAARLGEQTKDRSLVAESFKLYLEHVDGSDTEALCGLIKALATSDPETAEEYAQRLKVPDWVVDPEELELQPIPKVSQYIKVGGGVADEARKPKRKRKPRYPKGFDPANPGPPPDPERWLPKRDRTGARTRTQAQSRCGGRSCARQGGSSCGRLVSFVGAVEVGGAVLVFTGRRWPRCRRRCPRCRRGPRFVEALLGRRADARSVSAHPSAHAQ